MKYKSITQHEEFEENPFVEKAIQDIRIVKKTQVVRPKNKDEIQMITSSEGEVTGYSAFMRYVEVEEEKFAKVYLSQFVAFWELSKPAIRVFGYILSVLKPKQDNFYFIMEDCLKYTGYSHRNHVLTGLSNLIECSIIARSSNSVRYFINPLVVFNGDRVTFAKTYVKKKKDKEKDKVTPNQLDLFQKEGFQIEA